MEKLNIAEILKDCPSGMELDCTVFEDVYFDCIEQEKSFIRCYIQNDNHKISVSFTKYGCYASIEKSKCVIFPKGKTTWEGFQRPFKDGDILTTDLGSIFILKEPNENIFSYGCYVALNDVSRIVVSCPQFCIKKSCRLATSEEKEKLFKAIKDNGYKWNSETKTLEKLIVPKFKVGDKIKHRLTGDVYKVLLVISNGLGGGVYDVAITNEIGKSIDIKEQDSYELVPNKFDITTLREFKSRVLVRDDGYSIWQPSVWGLYDKEHRFPYITIGNRYKQCIPYDGNEHLLGTTNDCDDYYKTWEF